MLKNLAALYKEKGLFFFNILTFSRDCCLKHELGNLVFEISCKWNKILVTGSGCLCICVPHPLPFLWVSRKSSSQGFVLSRLLSLQVDLSDLESKVEKKKLAIEEAKAQAKGLLPEGAPNLENPSGFSPAPKNGELWMNCWNTFLYLSQSINRHV